MAVVCSKEIFAVMDANKNGKIGVDELLCGRTPNAGVRHCVWGPGAGDGLSRLILKARRLSGPDTGRCFR